MPHNLLLSAIKVQVTGIAFEAEFRRKKNSPLNTGRR
jgi:hypothetical protein